MLLPFYTFFFFFLWVTHLRIMTLGKREEKQHFFSQFFFYKSVMLFAKQSYLWSISWLPMVKKPVVFMCGRKAKNCKFHIMFFFVNINWLVDTAIRRRKTRKNKPPESIHQTIDVTCFSQQCTVKVVEKNLIPRKFYKNKKIKHSAKHSLYSEVQVTVYSFETGVDIFLSFLPENNYSDWLFLHSHRSISLLACTRLFLIYMDSFLPT